LANIKGKQNREKWKFPLTIKGQSFRLPPPTQNSVSNAKANLLLRKSRSRKKQLVLMMRVSRSQETLTD